jgi:hypothetical protein
MEAFWQKGHNCAFVAFVKVGLMTFGIKEAIAVEKQEDLFIIRLRNGRKWKITRQEVKELNKLNRTGFQRGKNDKQKKQLSRLKELVEIFYAVIIKHMVQRGYLGKKFSVETASAALNDEGMKTTYFHSLPGWKRTPSHDLQEKDLAGLKKKKHILLFSERHIVAASKGYYDRYGKVIKMNNHLPYLLKEKAGAWYSLC